MSKSLSQIGLPALGGAALALALGLSFANRNYGDSMIETLETQVEQAAASEAAAREQAMTVA